MINQIEVPMYLEEAIPEIPQEIIVNNKSNVYKEMTVLVAFTCENINTHNYNVVKKCFKIAEKLYEKGNGVVKNAVENIFVFSITRMLQSCPDEKKRILALIPITLYSLYIAQVTHKGC